MPFYDFKCKDCETIFTAKCMIAEKDNQACSNCGSSHYEHHHTRGIPVGDSVRLGVRTIDDGFREVLHKISKAPGSNLRNKLSRS